MEYAMPIKAKYKVGGKAAKHEYRTRTGPNCCTGNCAAKGPKKQYPYYPTRYQRKYSKG
jgi:hypothetical protein